MTKCGTCELTKIDSVFTNTKVCNSPNAFGFGGLSKIDSQCYLNPLNSLGNTQTRIFVIYQL